MEVFGLLSSISPSSGWCKSDSQHYEKEGDVITWYLVEEARGLEHDRPKHMFDKTMIQLMTLTWQWWLWSRIGVRAFGGYKNLCLFVYKLCPLSQSSFITKWISKMLKSYNLLNTEGQNTARKQGYPILWWNPLHC